VSRGPGGGEGQEPGERRKRARAPRPSPSQLPPEERFAKGLSTAMRLLASRERSRAELRAKLAGKGYPRETIEAVLDRLQESEIQSDERFAEAFTMEAQRSRGLSSYAVQGELRRRGVSKDLAAVASTEAPEDEAARAAELAARRASRLAAYPAEVRYRRILSFLARRGYPAELCRRLAVQAADLGGEPPPN
jgi:regulatory protein